MNNQRHLKLVFVVFVFMFVSFSFPSLGKSKKKIIREQKEKTVIVCVDESCSGGGAGIAVRKDGILFILTSLHVIENSEETHVIFFGSKRRIRAEPVVRLTESSRDIVLIMPEEYPKELKTLSRICTNPPEELDKIYSVGHPSGMGWSPVVGIVQNGTRTFLTDTNKNPDAMIQIVGSGFMGGTSGAAIVDTKGCFLGLTSMSFGGGIILATSAKTICNFFELEGCP